MMRLKATSASFKALTAVAVCAAMVMMGASGASASEDPATTSQEEVAVEAAPTNDAAPTQEQVAPAPAPAPEPAPAPAPAPEPAPAPAPAPAPEPVPVAEEAPAAPSPEKAPAVNTTTAPDQEDDNTGGEGPVAYTPPAPTFELLTSCNVQAAVVEVTIREYDTDMGQYRVGSQLVDGPGVYVLNTRMAIASFQSNEGVEVPVGSASWFFSVDEYCSGTEEPVTYNPPAPTFKQTDVCTEGGAPIVEVTISEYDRTMGQYRLFGEPLDGPGVYTAPGTQIRVSFEFADDVTPGEDAGPWSYTADKDCCEEPELPVVTLPEGKEPSFADVCGVGNDKVNLPANGANYAYVTIDHRVDGVGAVEVNLVANEGYRLPEGIKTHWEFTFTNKACPPVEEPEEPVKPEPQPPLTPTVPEKPTVPSVPAVNNGGTKVVKVIKGVGIGTGSEQTVVASSDDAFAGFASLSALFAVLGLGLVAARRRQRDA